MKERILEIINRKDLKDKEKIALIKYFIETMWEIKNGRKIKTLWKIF